jgi:hypothetical protein
VLRVAMLTLKATAPESDMDTPEIVQKRQALSGEAASIRANVSWLHISWVGSPATDLHNQADIDVTSL